MRFLKTPFWGAFRAFYYANIRFISNPRYKHEKKYGVPDVAGTPFARAIRADHERTIGAVSTVTLVGSRSSTRASEVVKRLIIE